MNGRTLIIVIACALMMNTDAQTLAPSSSNGRCRGVNVLTPAERAAGWRPLFDGTGTAGWHGYNKQSLESWTIDDCALKRLALRATMAATSAPISSATTNTRILS